MKLKVIPCHKSKRDIFISLYIYIKGIDAEGKGFEILFQSWKTSYAQVM